MTVQKGLIPVLAAPMLDPQLGRVEMTMPSGSTVGEIVAAAVPGLTSADRSRVRVMLVDHRGSMFVAAEHWHRVRPRDGVRVVIRVLAGKDALQSVLQIVVAVAAIALGAFFAPALAGALGISQGLAQGIIGLGVTVVGNLLINALIPPAKPLKQENRYQISGMRNRLEPDGAVPLVLGTMRWAPPFGVYSYTEVVGDWQYLRGVICAGYGPLNITGLRIGDTDISEYDEVEIETRAGLASDTPLSIVTQQVVEETVGAELLKPLPRDDLGEVITGQPATEEPVVRTTGADAAGASVILAWPAGLVRYNDEGRPKNHTVSVRIEQRRIDAADWTEVTTIEVRARKLESFYRQHSWTFPSRGRWQVRCTMLTDETTSSKKQQRTTWAALQTIRPEYPFDFPKPLAMIAFRIKATHQLNGQLDNLNVLTARPCLDYEHTTGAWVERETSNPASLFRYVLQSPANPKPSTDAGIDLDALADWHDMCRLKGLKYDAVIEDKATQLRDLLAEIAAAGRATPRHNGLKWSVTVDRPDKLIADHYSPRNSYDHSAMRSYVTPPDAFRIRFPDATNDYKEAERIVPWPGKESAELLLTEELQLPGKTDPVEIYREARRRMYEAIYRPDIHSVSKDAPVQVAVRGDRIRLSSDVINRVQVAARVISVSGRLIELDETVTMEAGKSYAVRFRSGLTASDTIGTSVVRTLVTMPGEHRTVVVDSDGTMPIGRGAIVNGQTYDGDLIHFGEAATLDYDLIVTAVEAGDDMSSHYRLVDAAPEIDQLTDALVIPPWSGRAGADIGDTVGAPPAPRFTSIVSGVADTDVSGQIDYLIEPGSGPVTTSRFEVYHRLVGAPSWTLVTIAAANGGGSITGYANGQSVQIYARALNVNGDPGPATATITFTVGVNDAPIPAGLDAGGISVGALLGGAVVQFPTGDDVNTTRVQLYRSTIVTLNRETDAAGAPIAVVPSRSYSAPLGDTTRANLLANGGMDSTASWALGTGWAIASGKATKTAGTASAISQGLAATAGKYYRIAFTLSVVTAGSLTPQLTGGSTRSGTARAANGTFTDRIQAVTGNNTFGLAANSTFAGSVDDVVAYLETTTCLAQGVHYIWLEPQNVDGVPGPVSGPFSVTIR